MQRVTMVEVAPNFTYLTFGLHLELTTYLPWHARASSLAIINREPKSGQEASQTRLSLGQVTGQCQVPYHRHRS